MGNITLFLIRHGESVDNVAGLLYGPRSRTSRHVLLTTHLAAQEFATLR
jgi:broad specificity phosphatase PhoE